MKNILITQCLQNDFVKPLASGEPLPNQLHIGHNESQRLVGEDIHSGPLGRFMLWATSQRAEQAGHLKQFSPHCIENTPGAEFIFSPAKLTARLTPSILLTAPP